ncbi:MAG: hypothetical protein AABZ64_06225 [Nitrospinota bacterium]
MMRRLPCPGCGQEIPVPAGARPGDLIACGNCAGVKFRLCVENGKEVLKLVQLVACPACGERIAVDDETPEGSSVEHDGRRFRLAKEFGAFSLEEAG